MGSSFDPRSSGGVTSALVRFGAAVILVAIAISWLAGALERYWVALLVAGVVIVSVWLIVQVIRVWRQPWR